MLDKNCELFVASMMIALRAFNLLFQGIVMQKFGFCFLTTFPLKEKKDSTVEAGKESISLPY